MVSDLNYCTYIKKTAKMDFLFIFIRNYYFYGIIILYILFSVINNFILKFFFVFFVLCKFRQIDLRYLV